MFCAKNLLCRAVLNLVENAVSASPQGGLVSLQAECSGNFLCLRVLDEGPGFSPEALRLGTQAFYSGDAARNPPPAIWALALPLPAKPHSCMGAGCHFPTARRAAPAPSCACRLVKAGLHRAFSAHTA